MSTLAPKEYCTGCTACVSACTKGCITMTADENGFCYPVIDDQKCVSCSLCEKACPVLIPLPKKNYGPRFYAVYSKDEPMRMESSSGGVFTELARIVLRRGGVVFGAAYNEAFEVVHICAENESELAELRGAKYAQSNLDGIFTRIRELLAVGVYVLFSGTPCQVAGLKSFLHRDYLNLVTIDFVCHGVPSPVVWKNYVLYRANKDNNGVCPVAINLRSKETGWSNYQYSNVFEYQNGSHHTESSSESLYMRLFVTDCINRASCANCCFKGYERCSDLTIGDFWGIWDMRPQMDDNKGTSVVIVQSLPGEALFEQVKANCVVEAVTPEEASAQNQSMLKSAPGHTNRKAVLKLARSGDFERCKKLLQPSKPGFLRKVIRKLRTLV